MGSVLVECCGFMRLRGAFTEPKRIVQLGPERGLHLATDNPDSVDPVAIYQLLTKPARDRSTAVQVTPGEFWNLNLWLALHEAYFCSLTAEGDLAERGLVPDLFSISSQTKFCSTVGLVGEAGLCLLIRSPHQPPATAQADDEDPFELWVRSFSPDDTLARRLIAQVAAWDAAGRPATDRLRIRAYQQGSKHTPSASDLVIQKRWTQLVLNWP